VWVAEGGLTSTAERAVMNGHYAIRTGKTPKVAGGGWRLTRT